MCLYCTVMNIVVLSTSCIKDETVDSGSEPKEITTRAIQNTIEPVLADKVVLGEKLNNPYSVKNMQLAFDELVNSNSTTISPDRIPEVVTTHYYVKFKPKTTEELLALKQDI